jgi:hypothetical protein
MTEAAKIRQELEVLKRRANAAGMLVTGKKIAMLLEDCAEEFIVAHGSKRKFGGITIRSVEGEALKNAALIIDPATGKAVALIKNIGPEEKDSDT